jgi:hypothetical protein
LSPRADVISAGGPTINAGGYTTCGVRTDARIVCWGDARFGQATVPVSLGAAIEVVVSDWHSCAVDGSGLVACWGAQPDVPANGWINQGQTLVPFGLGPVSAIAVGGAASCAVTASGTVACWGGTLGAPPALSGITDVTIGWTHACALSAGGTVACWGPNAWQSIKTPPDGLSGVTQLAAGRYHTCAVKADGTVVCWGGIQTDLTPPAGLTGVTQTASGLEFACALKTAGTVTCWGRNVEGQTTVPAGLSGVVRITAGAFHACALKADFSTICWGDNSFQETEPRSIVNRPPVVTPPDPALMIGIEGQIGIVPMAVSDPDGDPLTYRWTVNGNSVIQGTPGSTLSYFMRDNGTDVVTVSVSDAQFTTVESARVTVANVVPALGAITYPALPLPAGGAATIAGSFSDPGVIDTHSASVQWGSGVPFKAATVTEGRGSGTFTTARSDLPPGVYPITVRVVDKDSGVVERATSEFLVVYDPTGSYVTGKGAIQSPAGACRLTCYGTEGRATFGFTSRYQPGAAIPTGTTAFEFKAGNLDFASNAYQWLVVSGRRAQYKGEGTINAGGSYGFLLTAIDGDLPGGDGADRFRIKIWDKASGLVVYDNQLGANDSDDPVTVLANGGISIKK